ncbi:hypothetical protein [Serinibacter arcticus]|uniref:hypothetical protein n=1 Tax=Serinibacter arcticus TaxID=1655435 RepID=UPI001F3BB284|nr:hypothetical protein [Serinibacter arcticus]
MPTNRLLDAIRRRRNLKLGIPAMLLAVPYLLITNICTNALDQGAPGWLHLVVLWSVWNAMKFIIMGPISLVLLVRARIQRLLQSPGSNTQDPEPDSAPGGTDYLRRGAVALAGTGLT